MLTVFFICFATSSLACQFTNQTIPTVTQVEILSTPTAFNTEIVIPTNTLKVCPPNILTELPTPDIRENYIGQYILVNRNAITGLLSKGGQLVGIDNHMSNYARNDKSRLLLWEKEYCRIDNGHLIYTEIIDAVITPPLTEKQTFAIGCRKDKDIVPYVQAIIDINNNNVYSAWQIDITANKIIEIPIDGLSCTTDFQDFYNFEN